MREVNLHSNVERGNRAPRSAGGTRRESRRGRRICTGYANVERGKFERGLNVWRGKVSKS